MAGAGAVDSAAGSHTEDDSAWGDSAVVGAVAAAARRAEAKSYYSYVEGTGKHFGSQKSFPVTWSNAAASLYGSHENSPVIPGNRLTGSSKK